MTANTPAERVAEVLIGAGYRRIPAPLEMAGLQFDVAGAFLGGPKSSDLVIVGDTVEGETKVVQQIDGIARALDVLRSRRPLTSVIVGPRPVGRSLDALTQVGRTLAVEDAKDGDELRDRLAILLPLTIPLTLRHGRDLGAGIDQVLPDGELQASLYDASANGDEAVRDAFHEALSAVFDEEDDDTNGIDIEDMLG